MKKERFTVYRDTDYMYSSALSRAKENGIIGKEGLSRLIDSEPMAVLAEYGYLPSVKEGISPEERNALLDRTVALRFDEIEASLPKFDGESHSAVTPLRYPYDCNNIKAALKCSIAGADPRDMFFEVGTLTSAAAAALVSGDVKEDEIKPNRQSRALGLPENMAAAAKKARESYAESKNPRIIDLLLDRACYADMLQAAEAMGIPFLTEYVKLKIDSTNILTVLRLYRMYGSQTPAADELLGNALLEGGKLELSSVCGDREALFELLRRDPRFEKIAAPLEATESLSEMERLIDNVVSEFIASAKKVAFGAEVPLGYLLGLELSVKNVRIVMAGREAGLDATLIRERMRENYV